MIGALIMALITGALVGLFLKTVAQEVDFAHRSRMAFQATNLAEAGLETAIHALNNKDWNYWDTGSKGYYRDTYSREIDEPWLYVSYSFRGEQRHVKMYIEPGTTSAKVIAEGIVTIGSGQEVSRQVYAELGNRSVFANGLVAKETVDFKGNNVLIDSYKSSEGEYNRNGNFNRNANGSVASPSIEAGVITVGNADIYGSVAVGGKDNAPDVGPNGSIIGLDGKLGTVDPDRINYEFQMDLPDPSLPELPGTIETSISNKILGSYGTTTYYKISALDITNKDAGTTVDNKTKVEIPNYYQVRGNVVLIVDGDATVKGELKLMEDPNKPGDYSTLEMYVGGNLDVSGNSSSVINPSGRPTNLILYGMGTDKSINLAGNGQFYGAVYAPNYDLFLGGGGNAGEMMGAAVMKSIKFNGHYEFHYDEDLAGHDSDLAMKVTHWAELTDASERRNMSTILSDGL